MTENSPDLPLQEETNHAQIAAEVMSHLPGLSDDALIIAAAGVHATLALVQSNTRMADLMAQQLIEQETTNLFAMQKLMPNNHSMQPQLIHALQHRTIGCSGEEHLAVSVDKMETKLLADCLADSGLTVTSGDIITITSEGHELEIIVVEPSEDTWLFIQTDEYPMAVNSPMIATIISSDLSLVTLAVTPGSESTT